eukprot:gene24766-10408_t
MLIHSDSFSDLEHGNQADLAQLPLDVVAGCMKTGELPVVPQNQSTSASCLKRAIASMPVPKIGMPTGAEVKKTLASKNTWFGDFDYVFLCIPQWPWCRKQDRNPPKFFGVDEHLGIVTALFMGLQHCLAMTGGLITPPLLIGSLSTDPEIRTYLVQAALLLCSFTTFIQVLGFKPPRMPQLGAGILSVMGVSFASVTVFQTSIRAMMKEDGNTFSEAYGRMMGTCAICCIIPLLISFMPYRYIKRVFPPVVLGVTIMLIGIKLTGGSGLYNWGGGSFCGQNYQHLPTTRSCTIYNATGFPSNSTCYVAQTVKCAGNGFVLEPFGSACYIGLGWLVYVTFVFLEVFGSPFMRNGAVVIALLFGYFIAAVVPGPHGHKYIDIGIINQAPVATFLWTTTFKWGIYTPAFIPLFIVYLITSIETIGDVVATEEASKLEIIGQNNGVINLTGVASRQAGFACAFWLLLLGIFAKFGGWVLSIPNCVLGGMTTFLFANVIGSGIKILISKGAMTRRDRFILAFSLGLGVGISIVPQWATNNLWPSNAAYSVGAASFRTACLTVLSTPFCVGSLLAIVLNLILPFDQVSLPSEPEMDEIDGLPFNEQKVILDLEASGSDDGTPKLAQDVSSHTAYNPPKQQVV